MIPHLRWLGPALPSFSPVVETDAGAAEAPVSERRGFFPLGTSRMREVSPLSLGLALHKTSTGNGRQVREALVELPSDRGFLFASGLALTPIDISKRLAVSVEHLVAAGYLLDRLW